MASGRRRGVADGDHRPGEDTSTTSPGSAMQRAVILARVAVGVIFSYSVAVAVVGEHNGVGGINTKDVEAASMRRVIVQAWSR